jgi:hypothetical protein
VPVVLVASVVVNIVGTGQVMAAVGSVLLVAALGGIAWRIFQLTDEEWERWEVLPERRRKGAAAATQPGPAVA